LLTPLIHFVPSPIFRSLPLCPRPPVVPLSPSQTGSLVYLLHLRGVPEVVVAVAVTRNVAVLGAVAHDIDRLLFAPRNTGLRCLLPPLPTMLEHSAVVAMAAVLVFVVVVETLPMEVL
jgi:hypothetical protein